MDNVIKFPKPYIGPKSEILTMEEIEENLDMMKHYHIQETIANMAPMIFNQLELAGFPVSEEDTDIKDGAFVVEALRSIMCKHYDMYHPFQQISKNVFSPDDEELGALKIADSLNIELKKSETAI